MFVGMWDIVVFGVLVIWCGLVSGVVVDEFVRCLGNCVCFCSSGDLLGFGVVIWVGII